MLSIVISKKALSNPKSQRFNLLLSSKNFIVFAVVLRAMIHFELVFVQCEEEVQLHSFACAYLVVFSAQFAEKIIPSAFHCLDISIKNQVNINVKDHSGFSILFY